MAKILLQLIGALALVPLTAAASPFAYITNADANSLSVIDTATNTVIDSVSGLGHPFAVAVHPNGKKVYVSGASAGVVHVVDAFTNSVTHNIPVPGMSFSSPWGIAVTPNGSRVYVNNGINSVSAIDTATETVIATIPVTAPGFALQGLNINSAGTRVYTADVFSGTVSVIDTATNTEIAAPVAGTRFAIPNPAGTKVYAFEYMFNSISIVDAATNGIIGSISVPSGTCNGLSGGTINPSGTTLFVSCGNAGKIAVIDLMTDSYVTAFPVGFIPFGLDFLPDGSRLYVNNAGDNTVIAVDPNSYMITATIPVEDEPHSDGKFIGPAFVCGDSAVDPGEGCDDGNGMDGDGCSASCKAEHDTVLKAPKPLTVKIKEGEGSTTKVAKVKVLNADLTPAAELPGHDIEVDATSNCAEVFVSSIEYDGSISTGVLPGGKSATVKISIVALSSSTTFNKKAPHRCRITVTASTTPNFATIDLTPDNNVATFDVNVIDQNDPPTTTDTVHETTVASAKPIKAKIAAGESSGSKVIKLKVGNADYLPSGEAAALHSVSISALDGTCPALTIGSATFAGAASADVEGGDSAKATATASLAASEFSAHNSKSPARCRALITAVGPAGDTDASNNTTEVVIDVFDENDF